MKTIYSLKKIIVPFLVILCMFTLIGCEKKDTSTDNNASKDISNDDSVTTEIPKDEDNKKGTRKNPYTLNDTITVTTYVFKGKTIYDPTSKATLEGTHTFELSNFKIEKKDFEFCRDRIYSEKYSKIETVTLNVLSFDKKCISTYDENGTSNGYIRLTDFFDENMQQLDSADISDVYNDKNQSDLIYFEGTKYQQAFAMAKQDDDFRYNGNPPYITPDAKYDLVRFRYNDENNEEQYIYLKLE